MQSIITHWLSSNWELVLGYGLNSVITLLLTIPKSNGFWKVVKLLHGALDKLDPPKGSSVAKITGSSLLALALLGCGGSLHSQIEKALVFEQQVHTYQQQLVLVAETAIVMLPADQQAIARAKLTDANAKLSAALDAKDATLQAALDASASPVNLEQLIADIVKAVSDVVAVVNMFGVDRNQTEYIGRAIVAAQVRAVR